MGNDQDSYINTLLQENLSLRQQIARFTEQQSTVQLVSQQAAFVSAVREVTLGLLSKHNVDDLLDTIVCHAVTLTNAPAAYIATLDEDDNATMCLRAASGDYDFPAGSRWSLETDKLFRHISQTGQSLMIQDYPASEWIISEHQWAGSYAVLPLFADQHVIGILGLLFAEKNRLTDADENDALEYLARFASLALEKARLHSALKQELRLRQQMEDRANQLIQAVEQSPTVVVVTDLNGNITYINQKFIDLTGYSLYEALGRNPRLLQSGLTPPEVYTSMWSALTSGESWRGRFCNRKKNGELYWEQALVAPIYNALSQKTHYLALKEDVTARIEIEEQLRISQAHIEAIFNNPQVAITMINRQGSYINANQRWLEMTGYSLQEVLHMNILDLTHPDDKTIAMENLEQVFSKAIPSALFEKRHIRKDGSWFWTMLSTSAIYAADGSVEVSVSFITDITERKAAQQAAASGQARLEAIFNNPAIGISIVSKEGRIIQANQRLLDMLQYTTADTAQIHIDDITYPDEVGTGRHYFADLFDGKISSYTMEKRYLCRDGTHFWANLSVTPVHGPDGQVAAAIDFVEDFSARKQAEQALKENEEKFRSVIAQASDGIILANSNGEIIEWNCAQEELTGRSRAEMLGTSTRDAVEAMMPPELHTPQGKARRDEMINHILAGPNPSSPKNAANSIFNQIVEVPIQRTDGQRRIVQISYSHIVSGNTRISGSFMRDVTQQRGIEQQLLDAQKLATIGTLAGGVAHEVNNPLQAIISASGGIERDIQHERHTKETMMQRAEIIQRNAWKVANIVRLLQEYARPSSGVYAQADLNTLVNNALEISQPLLNQRDGIRVEKNLSADALLFECDANKISQTLVNLLTNARDSMPNGGVITLQTRQDAEKQTVIVSVADSGEGIPLAVQSKLFDPFFTTKQPGKGIGLGLSIVSSVVRSHGGEIDVQSSKGEGSIFTLTFPEKHPQEQNVRVDRKQAAGRYDD